MSWPQRKTRRIELPKATGFALVLTLVVLPVAGCGSKKSDTPANTSTSTRSEPGKRKAQPPKVVVVDFDKSDTSHDGKLDKTEIAAAITRDFKAMDLNKDGVVTTEDLKIEVRRQGKHVTVTAQSLKDSLPYDANGDGKVTATEYQASVESTFVSKMDKNHDGSVTREEAIAYWTSGRQGGAPR